jgi:tRNA uridine 5-carboxymethylaminomethyl modification enzyme
MFTSRAEYRLTLRADNADLRLTGLGADRGLVGLTRRRAFERRVADLDSARELVRSVSASPNVLRSKGVPVNQDGVRRSAMDVLGYPAMTFQSLADIWPELKAIPKAAAEQLEIEARYAGYLPRQEADIRAFKRDEDLVLPDDLDYAGLPNLSAEIRTKLAKTRPATLGAAARISGVTPAALTALLRHVRRRDERLTA